MSIGAAGNEFWRYPPPEPEEGLLGADPSKPAHGGWYSGYSELTIAPPPAKPIYEVGTGMPWDRDMAKRYRFLRATFEKGPEEFDRLVEEAMRRSGWEGLKPMPVPREYMEKKAKVKARKAIAIVPTALHRAANDFTNPEGKKDAK